LEWVQPSSPGHLQKNHHFDTANIFVDPTKQIHRALGLKYGIEQLSCSRCLAGTWRALWQGLTRCWCMCDAGDPRQQGAIFVMDRAGKPLFQHLERFPSDHAKVAEVFRAAGISTNVST